MGRSGYSQLFGLIFPYTVISLLGWGLLSLIFQMHGISPQVLPFNVLVVVACGRQCPQIRSAHRTNQQPTLHRGLGCEIHVRNRPTVKWAKSDCNSSTFPLHLTFITSEFRKYNRTYLSFHSLVLARLYMHDRPDFHQKQAPVFVIIVVHQVCVHDFLLFASLMFVSYVTGFIT